MHYNQVRTKGGVCIVICVVTHGHIRAERKRCSSFEKWLYIYHQARAEVKMLELNNPKRIIFLLVGMDANLK